MTASVLLERILTVGAVLEAAVGLGLLLAPSTLAELLLRAPLDGAGPIVARLGGGGLLALGTACWFARRTPSTAAGLGDAGVVGSASAAGASGSVAQARSTPQLPSASARAFEDELRGDGL